MQTPDWALTLSFWLHMIVTVTWIGGLAVISMLVIPIARKNLDSEAYAKFIRAINKRLDPAGWFGLAGFTVTGLIQMSANPNYEGFLAVSNPWSQAILIKHILFFLIIGLSAYQTWQVTPAIERAALLRATGKPADQENELQRKEQNLMRANLLLGVIILLLTAIARTA